MNKKIVFITGASRGLGRALAELLASEGFYVYSGVRNMQQAPKGTQPLLLDMTKEEDMVTCVEKIISEKGRIDILIHNAGIAYWGAADSMTLQETKTLFDVNFFGPFRLTQLVLPYMREKKSGKILFVSSIRAAESCAYMGTYAASKAALEAVAFDWAVTLQKWNIAVSIVQPGPMDTGIDIKHGSYFESRENPYLPYKDVSLTWQPVQEVCQIILKHLQSSYSPFRFQTSERSKAIVAKHLKDPSGREWYEEQKQWIQST